MHTLKQYNPRVFGIAQFLTQQECLDLIALAEASGFVAAGVRTQEGSKAMPSIRNNQRTTLAAPDWVVSLWQRLVSVGLPELEGERAQGLPFELRFYKYLPGERFKMHKDGPWHENGMSSRLTFLVYLSDDFTGGDTDFREFRISPQQGDALLFIHDTWHEGCAVQEGVKYVLRSDVLYR